MFADTSDCVFRTRFIHADRSFDANSSPSFRKHLESRPVIHNSKLNTKINLTLIQD